MELELREARPDEPEALALVDELSAELGRRTGADGRASFRNEDVVGERAVFLLAFAGTEAVGCGALRPIDAETCEIKRMYSRRQGRGVGSRVLAELERYAARFGYRRIWLETRKVNAQAVAFYLRQGYQVRQNYGKYAGNDLAVCFEKELSDEKRSLSAEGAPRQA